jgi:hypothetical protein
MLDQKCASVVAGRARAAALSCLCALALLAVGCSSPPSNPESFSIRSGDQITRHVKFNDGTKVEIWVTSEEDSDIDLFVFDENGSKVASDERIDKNCHVTFKPQRTQTYKIDIQNRTFNEPEMKSKNRDNRCTLKWEPKTS